jgi:RHS repeat-associated protein
LVVSVPPELSFLQTDLRALAALHEVEVVPHLGSVSVRVPIRTASGRADFTPRLALDYDSAAGNSPFGLGWSLSGLLMISRSTRRGFPTYDRRDTFVLTGSGELVPSLEEEAGTWGPRSDDRGGFWVRYYRPRIDSRIRVEQWTEKSTGRVHWRTRDARDVLTIFGKGEHRIADPTNGSRTFVWLAERQVDPLGNAIRFDYAQENLDNVDLSSPSERRQFDNTGPGGGLSQRYLKRVRYGNTRPLQADGPEPPENKWRFEIVFDYGDHADPIAPTPGPDRQWPVRRDAHSTFAPGFEVRTYRLCRRVLCFHGFEPLDPVPVASYTLGTDESAAGSALTSLTYTGARRNPQTEQLETRSLPPLRFSYAQPSVAPAFRRAPVEADANAPGGLGNDYRWVDLFGEGLPGVLAETHQAWYYKPNLGGGRFGPQQVVLERPAYRLGQCAITDFDGDGNTNLAVLHGRLAGFYEYERDEAAWTSFSPMAAVPHAEGAGTMAQWVDLNGDGRADLIVADPQRLTWYASEGKRGFAGPIEIARPTEAPVVSLNGASLALDLFFADMNGDGTVDQVRVRNGRVEYWAHAGHGRFGDPILMEGSPTFAPNGEFDPRRVFLVDLDGNGTADIVYVGQGEARYWINAGGNELIEGGRLAVVPYIDNVSTLRIVDFLGDGTPCLVWSSPLVDRAGAIQYLPLTDGVVPRTLVSIDNSMGYEVQFEYGSSARHYLRDKDEGRPWRTRLPFHRTVVEQKRVVDRVGGTRSAVRYAYHDGCFDGDERVFRGFGMVEQFDVESHDAAAADLVSTTSSCLRTWFHVGRRFDDWAPGRWTGDPLQATLPAQVVEKVGDLLPGEAEDAARAVAGVVLRQEVFAAALDGTPAPVPFEVSQSSYRVRRLQPSTPVDVLGGPAVFSYFRSERLDSEYEQAGDDPRTVHSLTLDVDNFGIARKECQVGYPRRPGVPIDAQGQQQLVITVTSSEVLSVDQADRYEPAIAVEHREYEAAGIPLQPGGIFTWDGLRAALAPLVASPKPFHEPLAGSVPEARLIGWDRHFYWNDSRTAPLALGGIGMKTLVHHTESACFTPDHVAQAYGGRVDATLLAGEGGYHEADGHWWRAGSTIHYHDADGFFQLAALERQDGAQTRVGYDADRLAVVELEDALGNRVGAGIDYHVMAPARLTDPNGTTTEVLYDPLGVPVLSTLQGHAVDDTDVVRQYGHDLLSSHSSQTGATLQQVVADPAAFVQGSAEFLHYDLHAWSASGSPPFMVRVVREALRHDGAGGGALDGPVQLTVTYFDGLQRVLQAKGRVEPGPAVQRDDHGQLVLDGDGRPTHAQADERWLVTGHTVYDRKQRPVRQYEPFHSRIVAYEPEAELAEFGVRHEFRYDAIGRVVDEVFSNGTHTRVAYRSWTIARFDQNDTVLDSAYRTNRQQLPSGHPERGALQKAEAHANTPTLSHLDPLGREIKRVELSGEGADRITEARLDAMGRHLRLVDPRGIAAFQYVYDMLGRSCTVVSVDQGQTWAFRDAHDRAIHAWNGRGYHEHRTFDQLDRPTTVAVDGGGHTARVAERMVYGEDPGVVDAVPRNLRGRLVAHYDQAGVLRIDRCAPGGEVLRGERQLVQNYRSEPDWTDPQSVTLEPEVYVAVGVFDALGRSSSQRLPDGTTRRFEYLPSGGVARSLVSSADGKIEELAVLDGAEYNARSQRNSLRLGNGIEIEHAFDPETFRTTRIIARRTPGGSFLQDLRYVYDPVGNIVHVADETQQPAFAGPFLQGLNVPSDSDFTYDAFYRLRRATGRVHQALLQHDHEPDVPHPGAIKGTRHIAFNNGAAVERCTRTYTYDLSGNLQKLTHAGTTQSWTTDFWISQTSNRSVPALDPSGAPAAFPESRFDAAGNLSSLPHLRRIEWTHRNTLARAVIIDRAVTGQPDDAEYYMYDGAGLRVRKVTERLVNGSLEAVETLYLEGCTIHHVRVGGNLVLRRLTSHVTDGATRLALIDRWDRDDLSRETDDIGVARVRYQLRNHLGSSQLELDEQGAVASYEEYFPFGGTAFIAGDSLREIRRRDYRFCGNERDDATGLYCVEHRYYAAWMGRWMSPDPIGPEDDANLYAYVRNNPVNLIDPDGLQPTGKTSEMPEAKVNYVPAGLTGAWKEAYDRLSPEQKKEWAAGRLGFLVDEGGVRPASRAEILAAAAERTKEGEHPTVGLSGVEHVKGWMSADGSTMEFDDDQLAYEPPDDATPGLLDVESSPGRSPLAPPGDPNALPSAGEGGVGNAAAGQDGGAVGAGGNAADGAGTSSAGSTDGAAAHPADGGSSPTPGTGGYAGSPGPGLGPGRAGPGGGGTSALGTGGTGSGGTGGLRQGDGSPGAGASPGRGSRVRVGGTGVSGGRKRGTVPGAEPGPGGGTRKEGPPGGTGKTPGGTGPAEGSTGAGTGPGIGEPGGTLPSASYGGAAPVPPQTLQGDDPFGSGVPALPDASPGESRAPSGSSGSRSDSSSPSGSSDGAKPGPRPEPTVGDEITRYMGYLNLEFGGGDPNGTPTGGIPGAFGEYHAGGWGQALYGVLTVGTLVLTVLSFGASKGAMVGATKAAQTAGKQGLKATLAGGLNTAKGFFGQLYRKAFDALRNKWAKQVPWEFGPTGSKFISGTTNKFGDIVIRAGMSGKRTLEAILHEGVHWFFSPKRGGLLATLRANLGMRGYHKFHVLRYLEEAFAQTVGTGSFVKGFKFPLNGAYNISVPRMIGEGLVYLGLVGGASYGTYQAAEAVGGEVP